MFERNTELRLSIMNRSDGVVAIELVDYRSGARVVQGTMSHEDLALALMGRADMPVSAKVFLDNRIGKYRHTRQVVVSVLKGSHAEVNNRASSEALNYATAGEQPTSFIQRDAITDDPDDPKRVQVAVTLESWHDAPQS